MTNIGQYLRKEREARGLNLTYISEVTKISRETLVSLEKNDLDALPAPTFVKGFIRAYSRCIGCDENDVVLRYEEYLEQSMDDTISDGEQRDSAPDNKPLPARIIIPAVLIAVTLLFFIIYPWERESAYNELQPKSDNTISGKQDVSVMNPAVKRLKNIVSPSTPEIKERRQKFVEKRNTVLKATAHETTWIKIVIDDKEPFEVLLRKGEAVAWKAKKGFSLVIGNASGIDLSFNGRPLKPLGKEGEVVRIKLYEPLPKERLKGETKEPA